MPAALDIISRLEKVVLSKEVLEATRVGLLVNSIRRASDQKSEFSRVCRGLIKKWQSLVPAPRPSSSSSRGGTPCTTPRNLISPALRRVASSLTPQTIKSQPNTPLINDTGRLKKHASATPSPKRSAALHSLKTNGDRATSSTSPWSVTTGYAPPVSSRDTIDSTNQHSKSLPRNSSAPILNGGGIKLKIKLGGQDVSSTVVRTSPEVSSDLCQSTNKLKRTASNLITTGLSSVNQIPNGISQSPPLAQPPVPKKRRKEPRPPSPPPLVVEGKPKLKSTAQLVAEMTAEYPAHMSINLDSKQYKQPDRKVVETEEEEEVFSEEEEEEREEISFKRKRGRPRKDPNAPPRPTRPRSRHPPQQEDSKIELVKKFLESSVSPGQLDKPVSPDVPPELSLKPLPSKPRKDWYSILPPLDLRVESAQDRTIPENQGQSLRERRVENTNKRDIITLPYVDIGMPDFVEFGLPNRMNFLSELNWRFRPPPALEESL